MNSHAIPPTLVSDRRANTQDAARPRQSGRTISSHALFQGAVEIVIEHNGALYRLKITRQGKLILNK